MRRRAVTVAFLLGFALVLAAAESPCTKDEVVEGIEEVASQVALDVRSADYFYPLAGEVEELTGSVMHTGRDQYAVDLDSDQRTVYPTRHGVVAFAGYNDQTKGTTSYGNTVAIDHEDGTYSIYTHLAELPEIEEGDRVTRRTILGEVGDSGCGGCVVHLHFVVRQARAGLGPAILFHGGEETAVDVRGKLKAR